MSADTEQNKATTLAFYEKALNQRDADAALEYVGAHYKQHNPLIDDDYAGCANTSHGFGRIIQVLAARSCAFSQMVITFCYTCIAYARPARAATPLSIFSGSKAERSWSTGT